MRFRIFIVLLFLFFCKAQSQVEFEKGYIFENFSLISSPYSELQLLPLENGQYLLMSDRRARISKFAFVEENPHRIFIVDENEMGKTTAINLPLKPGVDAGPFTCNSLDEIYFSSSNLVGEFDKDAGYTIYRIGIYRAWQEKGKWKIAPVEPFISKKHSFTHPSLSKDGKTMYLVSDMEDGLGHTDIYVSHKQGDQWSEPQNLGESINTKGAEQFPFYHESGYLYFTSKAREGYGAYDVYVSKKQGTLWGEAINLGEPINSVGNEFSFYVDEDFESGHVVSNRSGGKGNDDIYKFKKGEAPPVEIAEIPEIEALIPKNQAKKDKARKNEDLSESNEEFGTEDGGNIPQDLSHEQKIISLTSKRAIKIQGVLAEKKLDNIYFDLGSDVLNERSKDMLKQVAFLLKGEDLILQLHAHADAQGNFHTNVRLSEKRARSVMQYLFKQGITVDQIHYLAYGESDLYINAEGEAMLNRRVEFKLIPRLSNSGTAIPDNALSTRQISALESKLFYVQIAAVAQGGFISTYDLLAYGIPRCYFNDGYYKYAYGPYNTVKDSKSKKTEISEKHGDAFIYFNEPIFNQ